MNVEYYAIEELGHQQRCILAIIQLQYVILLHIQRVQRNQCPERPEDRRPVEMLMDGRLIRVNTAFKH